MIRNIREVYYDILNGPSLERLVAAFRWRNEIEVSTMTRPDQMVVPFTIADGIGSAQTRFVVHGLRWPDDELPHEVDIEVGFVGFGDTVNARWKGAYNYRTHRGWIVNEEGQLSIDRLECNSVGAKHAIEKLISRGITTIAELARLNEKVLLMHLVAEAKYGGHQFTADKAAKLLLEIRTSLEKLGLRFRGKRQTEEELLASLG